MKLKYIQEHSNDRAWHKEWIEKQSNTAVVSGLTIKDCTWGLASNASILCFKCKSMYAVESKKMEKYKKTKSDLCQYKINVRFLLALQLMGVGGSHATTLATFLNLPFPMKWKQQFNVLENQTYEAIQQVKNCLQVMSVLEEIFKTENDNVHNVVQNRLEDDLLLHRIEASYDMGWQVRSSGGKYGSRTGHGLLIRARTKKVLDSVVLNKKCSICEKHYSQVGSYNDVKNHKCMKNYEGTSKSMEAEALVTMLQRAPEKHSVSICTIISDDDSNGRAKAKHVSNGGKLSNSIEEPSFLADLSHHKRVSTQAIYNLASAPVKTSRVTKGLAGHLKYCYGACVKRNWHLSAKELAEKVNNILEQICDNHDYCDKAWCYNIKSKEENKVYTAPKDHRMDKQGDSFTHIQLKKIFDQYTTVE